MLKIFNKAYKYTHAGRKHQWPAFVKIADSFYKNRIKYFSIFHIVTLLITGIVSTTLASQKYRHGKEGTTFINKYKKFENKSKFLRSYYRYTGTETGFGFFAPDVKSHGEMFFESCETLLDLPFETNEGLIRGNCLITNVTEYINDDLQNDKKNTLKQRYSDLLIQNLVAKVRQVNSLQNNCSIVKVTYKLVEFPPLQSSVSNKAPLLFDIKTWIYETKN